LDFLLACFVVKKYVNGMLEFSEKNRGKERGEMELEMRMKHDENDVMSDSCLLEFLLV
jgi:hypothetical protein